MSEVFVVLKILDPYSPTSGFEMQGIFTSEESAVKACESYWNYMVGPVPLDTSLPHETMSEWVGAYYPNAHLAPKD